MQFGSNGQTACATCHFNAGADSRTTNQADPGLRRVDGNGEIFPPRRIQILSTQALDLTMSSA